MKKIPTIFKRSQSSNPAPEALCIGILLALCSCDPPKTPRPTNVLYYYSRSEGDLIPVQVLTFCSGESFMVIGTDHRGAWDNAIIYKKTTPEAPWQLEPTSPK